MMRCRRHRRYSQERHDLSLAPNGLQDVNQSPDAKEWWDAFWEE
jgi:hypothetical protein